MRALASTISRSAALFAAMLCLAPEAAVIAADTAPKEPVAITWSDLAPRPDPKTQAERDALERMAAALNEYMGGAQQGYEAGPGPGLVMHGGVVGIGDDGETLVADYDGQRVSMPGYALPLEFSPEGVTEFLLVPYIGACLHVPPPPPNQLVMIKSEQPYIFDDVFIPVTVTGVFSRFKTEIDEIESGYRIEAEAVVPYEQ